MEMEIPPLSAADRALLESGVEREAYEHAKHCATCAGWTCAAGHLNWQLRQLVDIALAHGHAITITPHPTDVTAAITIHEAGRTEPEPDELPA